MKSCYCGACQQEREARDMSIYYEDTSKALRCNSCLDDKHQKDVAEQQAIERAAKKRHDNDGLTQSQIGYSKSIGAAIRLAARHALEDRAESKRIDDFIGEL